MEKRWFHWFEEVVLVVLILLNVFDFFGILPVDLDYLKKLLSWTALGYLVYRASMTRIFFNHVHRHIDAAIVLSYFMLIFKDLQILSAEFSESSVLFAPLFEFIIEHGLQIDLYLLIGGSLSLLALAVYCGLTIHVNKPSLLHTIHEDGIPTSVGGKLVRVSLVYLVFISFFVFAFNLIMEWLALALDAPAIMLGILIYCFYVIRHYEKWNAEHFIFKIGEFGESFYEKFISLFHYERTIIYAVTGMLVLHFVNDAASFLIPFLFVAGSTFYFEHLGHDTHRPLIELFSEQIVGLSTLEVASLVIIYLLNVIAVAFLLLFPAVIWYCMFSKKIITIRSRYIVLVLTSLVALVITPVFSFSRLENKQLIGVDIMSHVATTTGFSSFAGALVFLLFCGALVFGLCMVYKSGQVPLTLFVSLSFFLYYVYLFFSSLVASNVEVIRTIFQANNELTCQLIAAGGTVSNCIAESMSSGLLQILLSGFRWLFSLHLLLFLTVTILFYVLGSILFVDDVIKEKVYNKIRAVK